MVQNRAVDEAVFNVTEAIRNAADAAIPKTSTPSKAVQTMVERFLPTSQKRNKGGRGASLYVDDLQISCEGSDMRMIERQLQTAVNNILKWCDTNGHSISASKSCCVHFCRKRGIHPDPEIRIRHFLQHFHCRSCRHLPCTSINRLQYAP
ncbi:putative RNA-directed DNA polymerase from transposon BS [Trichonephila clavipes]|uniref:Putative RNA-directed DNA polymerase from transposon BS n=1 Tax=Trichonephila clavipes TaxID=2585209 RepID=A0A8X6V6K0_TRICX|nr:putative RNA-directed DNA polymerase from transposon BS [Trichonephila clavipes]